MIGAAEQWKQTFEYDRYGNRRFDANNTTTLAPGCPTAVCNPTIDPATNKLIGYSFDNAGNTKLDAENREFIYDGENKQVEVKDQNGLTVGKYFYNGDGQRIKKLTATESTGYLYNATGQLVAEYATKIAQAQDAKVSYLTNDHLGSPRITTDANGPVISRRDFQPFGEEIARAGYGTDGVRQKFTGYERDNETDLDYAKARMYENELGRFTAVDPLLGSGKPITPQTWNRYSYTINNPLRFVDPDGLCSAPTGLQKGQVGICFEAFIAAPRIGPGGIGHGDGRSFSGNDRNLTARVTVWAVISTDEKMVNSSKTESVSASVIGPDNSVLSGTVTGPDNSQYRVDLSGSQIALQGAATTSVNVSNINSKVGEKDFGAGVDVTVSMANGTNGGQQLGKEIQKTPGSAHLLMGKAVEALSPAGTIDGSMTVRITGNGQVSLIGGESRGFPSYAGYAYTIGADGKTVVTQELVTRPENKIEDLTKPMTPFPK